MFLIPIEATKTRVKRNIMLVSFEEIEGVKNITAALEKSDENKAPEPLRAHYKDDYLFMWRKPEKGMKEPEKIMKNNTNLFFQTKDQWRRKRNEDVFTLWDFPFQGDECLPKAILMEKIF